MSKAKTLNTETRRHGESIKRVRQLVRTRIWVLALVVVLTVPGMAAAATEHGARLAAEGTSSMMIGGERVAAARQREAITITGSGFAGGEDVSLWATAPDGSVAPVIEQGLRANAGGAVAAEVGLSETLAVGLHRFSARGARSGRGGIAVVFVLPGVGPVPHAGTTVAVTPSVLRQLEQTALSGEGFAGGESVALWLTLPDGAVISLGRQEATDDGQVEAALFMPGELPVGAYRLTARGSRSGRTAIAGLTLLYGNGLEAPGAQLAATLGRAKQRMALNIVASGLAANESASFWLTLPNGAVMALGDLRAAGNGTLHTSLHLSETLPAGTHYLSFRGNRSQRGSFAKLVLEQGPVLPGEE